MKRKLLSIAIFMFVAGFLSPVYAQFNTVLDKRSEAFEILPNRTKHYYNAENKIDTISQSIIATVDSLPVRSLLNPPKNAYKEPLRKKHLDLRIKIKCPYHHDIDTRIN